MPPEIGGYGNASHPPNLGGRGGCSHSVVSSPQRGETYHLSYEAVSVKAETRGKNPYPLLPNQDEGAVDPLVAFLDQRLVFG